MTVLVIINDRRHLQKSPARRDESAEAKKEHCYLHTRIRMHAYAESLRLQRPMQFLFNFTRHQIQLLAR